jgi:hypothetical protein
VESGGSSQILKKDQPSSQETTSSSDGLAAHRSQESLKVDGSRIMKNDDAARLASKDLPSLVRSRTEDTLVHGEVLVIDLRHSISPTLSTKGDEMKRTMNLTCSLQRQEVRPSAPLSLRRRQEGTSDVSKEPIEPGEEGMGVRASSVPPGSGGCATVIQDGSRSDILAGRGALSAAGVIIRKGWKDGERRAQTYATA